LGNLAIKEKKTKKLYNKDLPLIISPNPFKDRVDISLKLQDNKLSKEVISLKIYNVNGQLFRQFNYLNTRQSVQMVWDGTDNFGYEVPEGVYFLQLETSDRSITKKVIKLE
jgi:flagellar hook assembly protein FlgD